MKVTLLLICLAAIFGFGTINAEETCSWHRTDIIVFVDQKNSTGATVLEQTVKPFLSTLITELKSELEEQKNHHVRVGIVTFGGQMVVQHCLSADQGKDTILSKIEKIKYAPGPTSFLKAFEKCDKADCFQPNSRTYKTDRTVLILMTDAAADSVQTSEKVAEIFKDRGYVSYGIGTGIEGRETDILKTLASEPHYQHVFNIRDRCSYNTFAKDLLKNIRNDQCAVATEAPTTTTTVAPNTPTTALPTTTTEATTAATTTEEEVVVQDQPAKLHIAADICFIIDASFSLSDEQFEQEKQFAVHLMQYIPMGEFGARFAAITFAYNVKIHYYLDDLSTPETVFQKTRDIPFNAEGATFTGRGIEYARKQVFSGPHFKPRSGDVKAAKIAVVITDGAPSRSGYLAKEARQAMQEGITILGVGVGPGFAKNRDSLLPMVGSKTENLFFAEQFDELNDKIVEVMDRLREGA